MLPFLAVPLALDGRAPAVARLHHSPFILAAMNPSAKEVTLEEKIRQFYIRYLSGLIAEPLFPKEPKDRQRLRQELTEPFGKGLKRLQIETDANPLLCAQDFFGEWTSAIRVEKMSGADFLVIFGPPPTKEHRVVVTLREEDGKWKIGNIQRFKEAARA